MVASPPPEVLARIDAQAPAFLAAMNAAEAVALGQGRPLTAAETAQARAVGVQRPEMVRVWVTSKFPGDTPGFSFRQVGGLTTGYAIHVRPKLADAPWLLVHELRHVAQIEEMGREPFVRRYLTEQILLKGQLIPLERDAIARSEAVLGESSPDYAF
ncbi:hypothetical protein [Tropicibacter naphthalenivorans]|uniref:hypothetical protein n=1 Tax=Tropicibacter naphthalenivorans TaxID=441103 RepID=UPI00071D9305|nr:hypothetical protein [Tropicibacter naphthalenivorans]SMC82150.1 hypothetical protein SAMN04488093_104379 [Tropicibacter naphthalenivorans]